MSVWLSWNFIVSQHYDFDLPWTVTPSTTYPFVSNLENTWCVRYSWIHNWPWKESSLRLTLNFHSVHGYKGVILSTGWLGRPMEEAVLKKDIQMFLEVLAGNQTSVVTHVMDGCSTVGILRRQWSFHFPISHFSFRLSLCLNNLSTE